MTTVDLWARTLETPVPQQLGLPHQADHGGFGLIETRPAKRLLYEEVERAVGPAGGAVQGQRASAKENLRLTNTRR